MPLLGTLLIGLAGALEFAPCTLADSAGISVQPAECAGLTVLEDRAAPDGRRIEILLGRIRARDASRRDHAVAVLAGGPGQAATEFYAAFAQAFAPLAASHDLLLLDQRGTGRSQPLDCDTPLALGLSAAAVAVPIREAAAACLEQLEADPRHYTTSVAVQDLEAVRAATGYRQLDLYAASYGTRVALHYLRRYPERVRTLVLDGVVPPAAALGVEMPVHAQRSLELIFSRCAADSPCAAAFPAVAERFEALREDLTRKPIRLELADPIDAGRRAIEFADADLAGAIRLLSYSAETAALLPLLIDAAAAERPEPLAAQALIAGRSLLEGLSLGMHNAVICSEDVPYYRQRGIDRAALARTYLGTAPLEALTELCSAWPRGQVDADLKAPLAVTAPALLLSGEADPITPPEFADRVAAELHEALHLVLPGQGHGQLHRGCLPRLIAAFVESGSAASLDVDCVSAIQPAAFFIDFSGPAP